MLETTHDPLVISFALIEEARGFLDQMRRVQRMHCAQFVEYRGLLPSPGIRREVPVLVVVTGVGATRAERAVSDVISLYHPRLWLAAGFAGGLSESLQVGDVVVAQRVLDDGSQSVAETGAPLVGLHKLPRSTLHFGDLVSTAAVIFDPQVKQALGRSTGALACDLESYAMAATCRGSDVDFLAVRAVSDTVHESLPRETETIAKQTSSARRWGAAIGAVWARPSAAVELWNLHERAWESSQRLGQILFNTVLPAVHEYLARTGWKGDALP